MGMVQNNIQMPSSGNGADLGYIRLTYESILLAHEQKIHVTCCYQWHITGNKRHQAQMVQILVHICIYKTTHQSMSTVATIGQFHCDHQQEYTCADMNSWTCSGRKTICFNDKHSSRWSFIGIALNNVQTTNRDSRSSSLEIPINFVEYSLNWMASHT